MKKFPPTKTWRVASSRVTPSTLVIATGSWITGMWQLWQLCLSLNSLFSHSW